MGTWQAWWPDIQISNIEREQGGSRICEMGVPICYGGFEFTILPRIFEMGVQICYGGVEFTVLPTFPKHSSWKWNNLDSKGSTEPLWICHWRGRGNYYNYKWAPSSEFVSSSIPSWQILTAHAQPFKGARDLAFCLKVPLDSLLVWASSEGSGETARMRRLAWTFAARIGDKYKFAWRGPNEDMCLFTGHFMVSCFWRIHHPSFSAR